MRAHQIALNVLSLSYSPAQAFRDYSFVTDGAIAWS